MPLVYDTSPVVIPGATSIDAAGINDSGVIVGAYITGEVGASPPPTGYIDQNGTITNVQAPGFAGTVVYDINDAGVAVGFAFNAKSSEGFIYDNGVLTPLVHQGAAYTAAEGINSSGEIVGWYEAGQFSTTHGYVYADGKFTTIDAPGAGKGGTYAQGINDYGQIAGYYIDKTGHVHGFLDTNGHFTVIDVGGATSTEVFDINNSGEMVGEYTDNTGTHGFLWYHGQFALLNVPDQAVTEANGINNDGTVVGYSRAIPLPPPPSTDYSHPFSLNTAGYFV